MRLSWANFKAPWRFSDWLPQRFLVSFMLFLCLCISYTMRFSIGLLLIDMTGPIKKDLHDKSCGYEINGQNSSSDSARSYEFRWSESLQGWIMSSFFYGYVIGTLASTLLLSDVRKGKRILWFGMGGSTLATLLIPFATRSNDASGIICMRISLGLGQGLVYPAVHAVVTPWVPESERGRLGSIIFSGTCFGNVLTHILIGFYLDAHPGHWATVFYFIALIGFVWTVLFAVCVPKTPGYHQHLTEKEKDIFERYQNSPKQGDQLTSAPWNEIVKSKPIWALTVACFGHDWGFFTVVLDLPKYMSDVLRYSFLTDALILGGLYLLIVVFACIGGFAVDMFAGKSSTMTLTRKLYNTLASIVPALGLFLLAFLGCDKNSAVLSFLLCFGFLGFFYPGIKINALELSPNHAGSVSSFVVALAATSGVLAPHINGLLTPQGTLDEWRTVFYLAAVVLAASNIIYLVLGSASIQDWNAVSPSSSQISSEDSEITKNEPSSIFISMFVSPKNSETTSKGKARQLWSRAISATQSRLDEAASMFMPRRASSTGDVRAATAATTAPSPPITHAVQAGPGPSGYQSSDRSASDAEESDLVKFMKQIIEEKLEQGMSDDMTLKDINSA